MSPPLNVETMILDQSLTNIKLKRLFLKNIHKNTPGSIKKEQNQPAEKSIDI